MLEPRRRTLQAARWLCALGLATGACHSTELPAASTAQQASVQAPPAPTPAPSPFTREAEAAAGTISADAMREHVAVLASDKFEGRGPATAGDQLTRAYLIEQLKGLGFAPGDGAQWEQPFDLVGVLSEMPKRWDFSLARGGNKLALKWWDDYIATTGVQAPHGKLDNAELVFVGYGIQAPEFGWDDFKGHDVRGKLLVIMNNDPDWDEHLFAGSTRLYYGRWTYKYELAEKLGAAGALIIHTTPSAGYPFSVVQSSWTGEQFELPDNQAGLQLKGWVTQDAARSLAQLAGKDLDKLVESAKQRDFQPVPLGIKTSCQFSAKLRNVRTANVFGKWPGTDPQLAQDYVIYTAHHDHLGIGKPDARGDKIYNGALDNAAGVAQVLAIAKAFKALPAAPKRSVMFLFVAAEEQGLLGSRYFIEHPTMPTGHIAANINYDGGNIWGRTRDVTYIGKGKSSLDAIVADVAERQHRTVLPDQFPDRGHLYRSDQLNFIKAGVPALYVDTGMDFIGQPSGWGKQQTEDYEAHHYHQPSDELRPEWNLDGMVEDARLGFWTGYIVANAKDMPQWVPGDEFEAARKAALNAAHAAP